MRTDDESDRGALGPLLRRYRLEAGLTIAELAEKAGLGVNTLSQLERGEHRSAYQSTITLIIEALNLPAVAAGNLVRSARRARLVPSQPLPSPGTDKTVVSAPALSLPISLLVQTSFVGREREEAQIMHLLARPTARLLTLVGPGGVGKTRLAAHVAEIIGADDGARIIMVALASATDASHILPAIAQELALPDGAPTVREQALTDSLRSMRFLVLDNLEHLPEAHRTVTDILMRAPELRILATSRSPLGLRVEQIYEVPELIPDEAVRLFSDRAQARRARERDLEDRDAIAAICARLDYLPLAIELAAARSDVIPPRDMLARLDRHLPLPRVHLHDLPDRQQSMEATIAWSYDLLSSDLQTYFARFAVFAGGWTLSAALVVCGQQDWTSGQCDGARLSPIDAIGDLVDASLIRRQECVDVENTETRFDMLSTIHAYARAQLERHGEVDTIRQAHADYFMRLAADAEPHLYGTDQEIWLVRLEMEHDNLRAVLHGAHEGGQHERGVQLVVYLSNFWRMRGYSGEGHTWAKRFLTFVDRTQVESFLLGSALRRAGILAFENGDYDGARSIFEECIMLNKENGDGARQAIALDNLGVLMSEQGDYAQALDLFQQGLSIARDAGDNGTIANTLDNIGVILRHQGDYKRAVALSEEALALPGGFDGLFEKAVALHNLALNVVGLGDYRRAHVLFRQSVSLYRGTGYTKGEVQLIEGVADLVSREGQWERAARLFGAADALRVTLHAHRTPSEQAICDARIALIRATISHDSFMRAWTDGQSLSIEQASTDAYTS